MNNSIDQLERMNQTSRQMQWIRKSTIQEIGNLTDSQKENVRDFAFRIFSSFNQFGRIEFDPLQDESDGHDDFLFKIYHADYFSSALDLWITDENFNGSLLYDFIEWQSISSHHIKLTQEQRDNVYFFVMSEFKRTLLSKKQIDLLNEAIEMWGIIPDNLSKAILKQESQRLKDARKHGEKCSVCNQLAKEYKVRFSVNMAVFLRSLVINFLQNTSEGGNGWIHYKECQFSSRNYPYVAHWGLAHTRPDPAGKKRTSGEWRPTQKGIDFIFNRIKVPLYVYTYNGEATGFDNQNEIGISEAFGGDEFDLSELMNLVPEGGSNV